MSLSENQLADLSRLAILAAQEAGDLIAQRAQQPIAVQKKPGGEHLASQVVTEVDHLSESIILKLLEPTCAQYDLALLTEERVDDKQRLEKDYFWCIDPLDGTLPFIEGNSGYAVSIALVSRSGEPVIGVIFDPVTSTLYSAVHNQGVSRNGQPWCLPASESNSNREVPLTLVCDRSLLQRNAAPQLLDKMATLAKELGLNGVNTISHGGGVMNACWVIENSPACYFKFPRSQDGGGSLWDYAATACLFAELGAVACDFEGRPLDLNRTDSTFMNHRGVIFAIDPSLVARVRELYSEKIGPGITEIDTIDL